MYCIKCGNQIPDNSNFCTSCGNPVEKNNIPTPPPVQPINQKNINLTPEQIKQGNQLAIWSLVCLISSMAVGGSWFAYSILEELYIFSVPLWIASLVLLIVSRKKNPNNTLGKVLGVLFLIQGILAMIGVGLIVIILVSCANY